MTRSIVLVISVSRRFKSDQKLASYKYKIMLVVIKNKSNFIKILLEKLIFYAERQQENKKLMIFTFFAIIILLEKLLNIG